MANRAIDFARSRAIRREVDAAAGAQEPAPEATPGPLPDELMQALAGLQPEHRAVVVLRYVLDLTPGEIAAAPRCRAEP